MKLPLLALRSMSSFALFGLLVANPAGATYTARLSNAGLVQEAQAVAVDQFGSMLIGGIARSAGANHDDGLLVWSTPDGGAYGPWRISTSAHERIHACVRSGGLIPGTFYGGSTSQVFPADDHAWMGVVDLGGALGWQKLYGGVGQERILAITSKVETVTGVGYTTSVGFGSEDGLALSVNEWDGAEQDTWTYGGPGADRFVAVARPGHDGFLFVGRTFSFGATAGDGWAVRVDSSGLILWQARFGGLLLDEATAVRVTSDGGFIIAGTTMSYGGQCGDGFLIKLTAAGVPQWMNAYGTPAAETATAVIQVGDHFILAGTTDPGVCTSTDGPDAWLLEVDALGNVVSSAAYGSATVRDRFDAVDLLHDGSLALAGTTGILPQKDLLAGRLTGCPAMENPCARPMAIVRTPFADWTPTTGQRLTEPLPVVQTTTAGLVSHGLDRELNCLRYSRTFKGTGKTFGSTMTAAGGFGVTGLSGVAGASAALVATFSASGDQSMVSTHSFAGFDLYPTALVELPDLGYIVGGIATATLDPADERGFLLRVEADGNFVWARFFSETGTQIGVTGVAGGADGFVGVVGHRRSLQDDVWVARVEISAGTLAGGWQTLFSQGGGASCFPGGIVQEGSRYIVAGFTPAGGGSFWLQEIAAATGVAVPITAGDMTGGEQILSIALTSTGDELLIAGAIDSSGWAASWDLPGSMMAWSWKLAALSPTNGPYLSSLVETSAGAFAAFGDVENPMPPAGSHIDGWIGRLTSAGPLGGERRYGGDSEDHIWSGIALPGGDLVAVGDAYSFSDDPSVSEEWILKTAPDGTISLNCGVVNDASVTSASTMPVAATSPSVAPASVANNPVSSTSAAACTPMQQQCP